MGIVTSTGKQLGLGVAQPLVILVTHSFASRSTKMNKTKDFLQVSLQDKMARQN